MVRCKQRIAQGDDDPLRVLSALAFPFSASHKRYLQDRGHAVYLMNFDARRHSTAGSHTMPGNLSNSGIIGCYVQKFALDLVFRPRLLLKKSKRRSFAYVH